jgi:hypothetical protein
MTPPAAVGRARQKQDFEALDLERSAIVRILPE